MGFPCVFSRLQTLPVDPTPGALFMETYCQHIQRYLEVTRYGLSDRSEN